ncbi:hypothetical protein [Snodgrassella alvi]|uniref:hypothetical protein n=1 Tax=Snodgrassella alvi TaxID=1196083 RepID=UPI001184470F|nr:hypothetical protein [Snodgrassella alvi]
MRKKNRKKKLRFSDTFLDLNITRLAAPHIPSANPHLNMPNGIIMLKGISGLMKDDDKIFINLFLKERVSELKAGNISNINFSRLVNTLYMAYRLSSYFLENNRCKEEKVIEAMRDLYTRSFNATSSVLQDMSQRREQNGRYVASGDNIVSIESIISVLDSIIEITTVGEWYTVWHKIVLELMELDRKNIKKQRAA